MRTGTLLATALVLVLAFAPVTAQDASTAGPATLPDSTPELSWPRRFEGDGKKILIYQPQIEDWTDNRLQARTAVSITTQGKNEPTYGVAWITARTDVDKTTRMVELDDIAVARVSFPQHKDEETAYQTLLNKSIPDTQADVPLDHLEANLAIAHAAKQESGVPVKNDPPKIIFSSEPSILILIDGEPSLKPVENTSFMRVVNTRSLILLDGATESYYLTLMNRWVTSKSAMGPWTLAPQVPATFESVKEALVKAGTIDPLIPKNPDSAPVNLPKIYTSDSPAELIQSRGEPEYTPIEGTQLLYMKNTENAVFMMLGSQDFYVLVSGRWFRAKSLQGPWSYVPGKELAADFAKIPPDSAKANVLVSVPGTPQAQEARIANSIPQTAAVNINETKLTVTYDGGTPHFTAIPGTAMTYASNCGLPVIAVNEGANVSYWGVQNGVWFFAPNPLGPWMVAKSVPPVIYSIPPSCPVYYATYVRIYGTSGNVVYVGYTPGYMGTCVTPDGVVVYGTGYYYPAYVGTVWYGYPPTYGYGAGFACGAVTGFAFGFAAGAIIGDCWSHPYWGPCHGFGSININSHSVYTNWHGGVASVNRHYQYDASTGKSVNQAVGRSFNPYTGRASVGGYSNYLNRDSGNFDVKQGGATYNPRTGTVAGGGRHVTGNVYDGNVNVDRGGFRYNTRTNTGMAAHDGDVYAGHDGSVYRHTDDGGWQHHTDSGWEDAQRSDSGFSSQRDNFEQERSARDLGDHRFGNFGGFGGGGGFRFRRR